jgi:hypothetical protein
VIPQNALGRRPQMEEPTTNLAGPIRPNTGLQPTAAGEFCAAAAEAERWADEGSNQLRAYLMLALMKKA